MGLFRINSELVVGWCNNCFKDNDFWSCSWTECCECCCCWKWSWWSRQLFNNGGIGTSPQPGFWQWLCTLGGDAPRSAPRRCEFRSGLTRRGSTPARSGSIARWVVVGAKSLSSCNPARCGRWTSSCWWCCRRLWCMLPNRPRSCFVEDRTRVWSVGSEERDRTEVGLSGCCWPW